MAIVRLEAFKQFQRAIEIAAPDLKGHIFKGQPPPSQKACYPALTIQPVRFRYEPSQEEEVYDPAPDRVVMNVGRFYGTIQLRLAAATLEDRWRLEEQILAPFLGTPMHPGILLTQVTACESLGPFMAAWELDDDEWQDEKVFSDQFWAVTVVTAVIPALVTRLDAHTIETLRFGLGDLDATDPVASNFVTTADVDVVTVNQDGSLTPV